MKKQDTKKYLVCRAGHSTYRSKLRFIISSPHVVNTTVLFFVIPLFLIRSCSGIRFSELFCTYSYFATIYCNIIFSSFCTPFFCFVFSFLFVLSVCFEYSVCLLTLCVFCFYFYFSCLK